MAGAWDAYVSGLGQALDALGDVAPLDTLDDMPSVLSDSDRRTIVEQAQFGIGSVYAHLPLKRVRHSLDPIRGLELLSHRLEGMSDREFHTRMMAIFDGLGDIHTGYRPPPPRDRMIAFLPFIVERYFDEPASPPGYVVTRLLARLDHETFRPGVTITSWNGMPIDKAIARFSEESAGSNPAAEEALAVQYLTIRWLGSSLPPAERWVIVGFANASGADEIRLPWALLTIDPAHPSFVVGEQAVWMLRDASKQTLNSGINVRTHLEHVTRRRLFAEDKVDAAVRNRDANVAALAGLVRSGRENAADDAVAPVGSVATHIPEMLEAAILPGDGATYGYLRIRGFQHETDSFVAEVQRLVDIMPGQGLIIDIRGNPGGIIPSAERLLQLFTPKRVQPLGFQFIGTPVTDTLTHSPKKLEKSIREQRTSLERLWGASIDIALETGTSYSKSVPLTDPADANAVGQRYLGPVILITDAITYSAGDMFAAGFQDHGIGPILATDESTGGGGANLWSHAQVAQLLPDVPMLAELPGGVHITYAIRRCLRGGPFAGLPIEELGVRPDAPRHFMTRRDVLHGNEDLLAAAMAILAGMPRYEIDVVVAARKGALEIKATAQGADRLDFYLDGRPAGSASITDTDPATLEIATDTTAPHTVLTQAFAGDTLVAAVRRAYETPTA